MRTKALRLITALSIGLIVISCKRETEIKNDLAIPWDCSIVTNKPITLNNLFHDSRILGLEETENSIIGRIDKIIHEDSIILVLDRDLAKKVFIFNATTGAHINNIGEIGSGPTEYTTLNDVTYDQSAQTIHILCNKNKLLSYSLDGKLIGHLSVPFRASDFEFQNDKFYFACDDISNGEVAITDEKMQILHRFFKHNDINLHVKQVHPFQKNKDGSISYIRFLDNNIYQICDADSIKVKYHVDFGENSISRTEAKKVLKDHSSLNNDFKQLMETRTGDIKYFIENENAAIITYYVNNQPHISILDKTMNRTLNIPVKNIQENVFGLLQNPLAYVSNHGFIEITYDTVISPDKLYNPYIFKGENPYISWFK